MNIEIANRLVELRKAHGLSQEELASKLGLSRQAVSKWERAESSPDTDNLIMLSRLYGVSLDALLATDEEIPRPEPEPEPQPEKEPGRRSQKQGVHVSFRDGINVTDDDGSRVHVGWDGIYVNEEGAEAGDENINSYINDIEVDEEGVTFTENGERVHRDWNSFKHGKNRWVHKTRDERTGAWRTTVVNEDGKRVVIDTEKEIDPDDIGSEGHGVSISGGFPYTILVTGVFLLLGFLKGWWHPGWMLFLTIPIYYPVVSALRRRKFSALDIIVPVVVTGAYAALGLVYNAWHPLWLMLLAIPAYFAVSGMIKSGAGSVGKLTGVWTMIVTIAYIVLGFTLGLKAWSCGWLLFFTVPMFASIAKSVERRDGRRWLVKFPWEVLIVGAYLFVGLMWGIWHPTWIAFVLIPVWRWLVSAIAGPKAKEDDGDFDWEDDEEEDEDED